MKISCIIPAHNEEGNLEKLISKLIPVLESHRETKDYEIVLVDDNSTDNTPFIVDRFAKDKDRIKAIHRTQNPGFGKAIKTGFKHASGDIIIPVMGDLSDDPRDIPKLVKKIEEGYDVVYGSRFVKGGRTEGYPNAKKVANRLFNNTVRLLFGIRHKDVTNAFKAYRKEVLEEIGIENIEANGFDITVEIPLKAHILGFKSAEVPTTWYGREKGEAKLKLSKNGHLYGKRLLKMFVWGNIVALGDLFGAVVKGSLLRLFFALIFGLLILVGLFKLSGFSEIFNIIKNTTFLYVAIACAMILMTFVLRTWRWSVLLRSAGFTVHRDTAFKCIMFGWLLNYLLPARVGDVARGVALKTTDKTPLTVSLSTIVIERSMDMLTLAFILSIAIVLFLDTNKFIFLVVGALGIAIALLLVLFIFYKFPNLMVKKLKFKFPNIEKIMVTMKQGLEELYKNPEAMVLCLILSLPIWLFEISSIYFSSRAVNFDISFLFAGVSGIATFIAQVLPLTPAGIGIHEGTITGILLWFEVPKEIGTSIALVDHFARGLIIYSLGILSAIHIGFQSREYFVKHDVRRGIKEIKGDE